MTEISAVIPAAGRGKRVQFKKNKLLIELLGKPLLAYTLEVFQQCRLIDEVILIAPSQELEDFVRLVEKLEFPKVGKVVAGGKERQDSVYNGLREINPEAEIIVIHDGARPFVTPQIIEASIKEARNFGAAVAAVPLTDTVKVVDDQNIVITTLDRKTLWAIQTPQTFRAPLIIKAYQKAFQDNFIGTDDAMLVERLGYKVKVVPGSHENIKITLPEDLQVAEAIIRRRVCGTEP